MSPGEAPRRGGENLFHSLTDVPKMLATISPQQAMYLSVKIVQCGSLCRHWNRRQKAWIKSLLGGLRYTTSILCIPQQGKLKTC